MADDILVADVSRIQFAGYVPTLTVFARATAATYFDSNLTLQSAPANTLRDQAYDPVRGVAIPQIIEPARTNSVRNPRAEGANVGTNTLPTNWASPNAAGLTRQVIGTGVEDGIPYLDVRYFGTSNSTIWQIICEPTATGIPCTSGQQWTASVYLRMIGGSLTNFATTSGTCLELVFYNSAGVAQVTGGSTSDPAPYPTNAPLRAQRYVTSFIPTNATITQFTGVNVRFNIATASAIDFTLRIGAPQAELISNSPTNFSALFGGGWVWTAIVQQNWQPDPVGTSRAVFITDTATSSTHFITQASGTVAQNQPLTYSVYVKDGGRRYMRFQIFDTASSGNQINVYFDTVNGVVTQPPTIGGVGTNVSAGIIPVGGGWFRAWTTGTLSTTPDTTVSCRIYLYQSATQGTYADGTGLGLYLWGQQLEVGSSLSPLINIDATSTILPVVGTPVATTRAADQLYVPLVATGATTVRWTGYAGSLLIDTVLTPTTGVVSVNGRTGDIVDLLPVGSCMATLTGNVATLVPADFTRASQATYFDSTLTLRSAPIDIPRYNSYDPVSGVNRGYVLEAASTNAVRNPRGEGSVVLALTTLPTNWVATNTGASTWSIVGTGVEDGIPYADIRTSTTTNGNWGLIFEGTTVQPALVGQQWCASCYVRLVAGSIPGTTFGISAYTYNSSGSGPIGYGGPVSAAYFPTNAPLRTQRIYGTGTITAASQVYVTPRIGLTMTAGPADFTLRFGVPQIELMSGLNMAYPFCNGWTINTGIVQTFFQPDPFNRSRAVLMQDTAVSTQHYTHGGAQTISPNQQMSFSIFAKDAGRRTIMLTIFDWSASTNFLQAQFDLQTGLTSAVTAGGNASGAVATMTPMDNGWYRCNISGTPTSNGADTLTLVRLWLNNSSVYTGNGSGVYVFGPQLQIGPLTDYISIDPSSAMLPPVGAPQVTTRAADMQYVALAASTGQMAITGFVPAVSNTYLVPTGIVKWTGSLPSLIARDSFLAAGRAAVAISGRVGDVLTVFPPAKGAVAATGYAPVMVIDTQLNAHRGRITITADAPTVLAAVLIVPTANIITVQPESRTWTLDPESRTFYVGRL